MVCLWQVADGSLRALTNYDTQEGVYSIAVAGGGSHSDVVFAGCAMGGVCGWDIRSHDIIFERYEGSETVCSVAVNSQHQCSACTKDGVVTVWDLRKDVQLCQFSAAKVFSSVEYMLSDAQRWILLGGKGHDGTGRLSMWDLSDFRERSVYGPFSSPVTCFTEDVAVLCSDGDVSFVR